MRPYLSFAMAIIIYNMKYIYNVHIDMHDAPIHFHMHKIQYGKYCLALVFSYFFPLPFVCVCV